MGSPSYWTKVKVSAKPATCLLEALRQNPFSCLFQLLESVPSLHSWPWITCSISSGIISPSLSRLPLTFSHKDLVMTWAPPGNPGSFPSQIIFNPISKIWKIVWQ